MGFRKRPLLKKSSIFKCVMGFRKRPLLKKSSIFKCVFGRIKIIKNSKTANINAFTNDKIVSGGSHIKKYWYCFILFLWASTLKKLLFNECLCFFIFFQKMLKNPGWVSTLKRGLNQYGLTAILTTLQTHDIGFLDLIVAFRRPPIHHHTNVKQLQDKYSQG